MCRCVEINLDEHFAVEFGQLLLTKRWSEERVQVGHLKEWPAFHDVFHQCRIHVRQREEFFFVREVRIDQSLGAADLRLTDI